jgi:hypothetical protein
MLFPLQQSPTCSDYSKERKVVRQWHLMVSMTDHRLLEGLRVPRRVYYDNLDTRNNSEHIWVRVR